MSGRRFLLLGSGEFEPWSHEVEARALREATGDGSVVILPTASSTEGDGVFDRWARMGFDHYAESGVPAEVLPVKVRDDAAREDVAARAEAASMIYFSGGKPTHLAEVLHDSALLAAILRAMDRGAVWAGCSGRCGGREPCPHRWDRRHVVAVRSRARAARGVRGALGSGPQDPRRAVVDVVAPARGHVVRGDR